MAHRKNQNKTKELEKEESAQEYQEQTEIPPHYLRSSSSNNSTEAEQNQLSPEEKLVKGNKKLKENIKEMNKTVTALLLSPEFQEKRTRTISEQDLRKDKKEKKKDSKQSVET